MPSSGGGTGTPISVVAPTSVSVEAQEAPLLPLDTLREMLGFNPWHFWGLTNSKCPITSGCNTLLKEYNWQDADQIGRSSMRRALLEAENLLKREMGFSVAPHYTSELVTYADTTMRARSSIGRGFGYPYGNYTVADPFGRWVDLRVSEGYVQAVGVESLTLLGTPSVAYSDTDGDGLYDTFTISVTTTVTDVDEIAVYFAATDRLNNEGVGQRWKVEPVRVSISGGTCTIRGRAWTVVKPILYEGSSPDALDPDTLANYVTSLEVYQRTIDANGQTIDDAQAVLYWETVPLPNWWGCWADLLGSTDPATVAAAIARVGIRNKKMGLVYPGQSVYNSSDGTWSQAGFPYNIPIRRPDRVFIRYYAGYPLDSDGQMNRLLQQAVGHLAIARMADRPCACDGANREWYRWSYDLSRVASPNEQYATTRRTLNNIFGTRRGEVDAFNKIQRLSLQRGIAVG